MSDIVLAGTTRTETKDYEQPEAGSYAGRCVRICDLGTHVNDRFKDEKGNPVKKREVEITWELSELMQDGRPFVVSWRGGMSLNEKSKLYKLLTDWRGKAFTSDELGGFSLKNLLDKTCFVSVVHRPWKSDPSKFSAEVQSVMPLPKGMQVPDRVNDLFIFNIKDIGTQEMEKLWPRAKKLVMQSQEFLAFDTQGAPMSKDENEPPF